MVYLASSETKLPLFITKAELMDELKLFSSINAFTHSACSFVNVTGGSIQSEHI
jgi:hypothetical protein